MIPSFPHRQRLSAAFQKKTRPFSEFLFEDFSYKATDSQQCELKYRKKIVHGNLDTTAVDSFQPFFNTSQNSKSFIGRIIVSWPVT